MAENVKYPIKGLLEDSSISDRHRAILEAAAALFAERGYAATSVREIGERVGLLGGSLYHHIKSKEALFVRINEIALRVAGDQIFKAIAPLSDPWARLEVACITMAEIQLDPNSLTMPLMNSFASAPVEIRHQLIEKRDNFELVFRDLITDLPLDPSLDRDIYRLLLLTLLNNVGNWYRPGRMSPRQIGQHIVKIFRHEVS